MANESYGSIIHNGVNYSLGSGVNSANKTDISSIILTGTTNTSGNTITAGTWFYLNGEIVKAKVDIASNATFTKDTNYEEKTIGEELSELNSNSSLIPLTTTQRFGYAGQIDTYAYMIGRFLFIQIFMNGADIPANTVISSIDNLPSGSYRGHVYVVTNDANKTHAAYLNNQGELVYTSSQNSTEGGASGSGWLMKL